MNYINRAITPSLLEALKLSPIVFLNGPRQAGKSTLVHQIAEHHLHAHYLSLDNLKIFSAAESDPLGFLGHYSTPLIIDEIQMVPTLFRVLKERIDTLRTQSSQANTQYLLTGSTNIMALPELADTLVGRMRICTLYPLSMSESLGLPSDFLKNLFAFSWPTHPLDYPKFSLEEVLRKATFPEVVNEPLKYSTAWFDDYLTTLLQRDVRTIAEIEKLAVLPNMIQLLATRLGTLNHDAAIASQVGLNKVTYARYKALLFGVFLIFHIQPWFKNLGKRLVKAPKIFFTDTALAIHVLGMDAETIHKRDPFLYGRLVENFIATELLKQINLTSHAYRLYHCRTDDQKEIDFVIEQHNGDVVGIEVKSSSTVQAEDFKHLKYFAKQDPHFIGGVVLYAGTTVIPFGDNFFAIPISALWASLK